MNSLSAAMQARSPQSLRAAISALMLSYPSSRASGDEAKAIIAAYEYALADLPTWAVAEAVQRFIRGKVAGANAAFAPSSAEVRTEAEKATKPITDERDKLGRLLRGVPREEQRSPGEQDRIAKGFEDLKRKLGAPDPAKQRVSSEAWLRDQAVLAGNDPAALDAIPDAPERAGTFARPKA